MLSPAPVAHSQPNLAYWIWRKTEHPIWSSIEQRDETRRGRAGGGGVGDTDLLFSEVAHLSFNYSQRKWAFFTSFYLSNSSSTHTVVELFTSGVFTWRDIRNLLCSLWVAMVTKSDRIAFDNTGFCCDSYHRYSDLKLWSKCETLSSICMYQMAETLPQSHPDTSIHHCFGLDEAMINASKWQNRTHFQVLYELLFLK